MFYANNKDQMDHNLKYKERKGSVIDNEEY